MLPASALGTVLPIAWMDERDEINIGIRRERQEKRGYNQSWELMWSQSDKVRVTQGRNKIMGILKLVIRRVICRV